MQWPVLALPSGFSSFVSIRRSDPAADPTLRVLRTQRRPADSPRPFWRRPRSWDDRVAHLEQLASTPAFLSLRHEIIALARLDPSDRALDIGAGTGLLTVAAAPNICHVTALDISPAMCRHLETKLAGLQIANVDVLAGDATQLPLAEASVDVVVSNYCLHHLRDPDKRQALAEAARVLRPGGRIVIGDMMFQIGLRNARDRALIAHLVSAMIGGRTRGRPSFAKECAPTDDRAWRAPRQRRLVASRARRCRFRRGRRAHARTRRRNRRRASARVRAADRPVPSPCANAPAPGTELRCRARGWYRGPIRPPRLSTAPSVMARMRVRRTGVCRRRMRVRCLPSSRTLAGTAHGTRAQSRS